MCNSHRRFLLRKKKIILLTQNKIKWKIYNINIYIYTTCNNLYYCIAKDTTQFFIFMQNISYFIKTNFQNTHFTRFKLTKIFWGILLTVLHKLTLSYEFQHKIMLKWHIYKYQSCLKFIQTICILCNLLINRNISYILIICYFSWHSIEFKLIYV